MKIKIIEDYLLEDNIPNIWYKVYFDNASRLQKDNYFYIDVKKSKSTTEIERKFNERFKAHESINKRHPLYKILFNKDINNTIQDWEEVSIDTVYNDRRHMLFSTARTLRNKTHKEVDKYNFEELKGKKYIAHHRGKNEINNNDANILIIPYDTEIIPDEKRANHVHQFLELFGTIPLESIEVKFYQINGRKLDPYKIKVEKI